MSANPIDDNSTPKTTGSLEELFRHHLGEEAAVPPRPMLWDQIDNSLLIRQNEIYRRRLVATRWVAAASLLLATLAGTGWWAGRNELLGGAEMATNSQSAASGARSGHANSTPAMGNTRTAARLQQPESQSTAPIATTAPTNRSAGSMPLGSGATGNAPASAASEAGNGHAATNRATLATATQGQYTGFGTSASSHYLTTSRATSPGLATQNSSKAGVFASTTDDAIIAAARETQNGTVTPITNPILDANVTKAAGGRTLATAETTGLSAASTTAAIGSGAVAGTNVTATLSPMATVAATTEQMGLLSARQASLTLANATLPLPTGIATVPVEELPAIDVHRWRYSASYAAGVFNPNVNFSRAGIEPEFDYNRGPAFGTDSPTLTEAAATEYRNNLRPGLSQRIALLATRHLRGHWSLSTGAEFTQARAQSASSSAFVGEQLFDLGQASTNQPLRTTDFRYSMASIPLEVRYSNPVKRGWSIYGRLGGVVTALLGVRSDVQGDPEATRTYSITSAGGPYRRLMGSVRGGAGAQFRPSTSKWAFSMGPTADLGLVALNAHPVQSYFAQSHPYSIGLEAAVEFGR